MVDDKVKKRVRHKFAARIQSSKHLFWFEDFELKNEIVDFVESKGVTTIEQDLFLIFFASAEYFLLITKMSFILYFKNQLHVIEFINIQVIQPDSYSVFAAGGTKMDIRKICITTTSGQTFFVEFLDQDDLFIFYSLLGNIPFRD